MICRLLSCLSQALRLQASLGPWQDAPRPWACLRFQISWRGQQRTSACRMSASILCCFRISAPLPFSAQARLSVNSEALSPRQRLSEAAWSWQTCPAVLTARCARTASGLPLPCIQICLRLPARRPSLLSESCPFPLSQAAHAFPCLLSKDRVY